MATEGMVTLKNDEWSNEPNDSKESHAHGRQPKYLTPISEFVEK